MTSNAQSNEPREHRSNSAVEHPKNLAFMVGWLVFLGIYQIFLAWKFGTFFEGTHGDLRHYFCNAVLEPLYAAIGITALVVAWGGWHLRPWAYKASFVLQGLIYLLILGGIIFRILGKPAPIGWLLLDAAFGAYNLWWLTRPYVRQAFLSNK